MPSLYLTLLLLSLSFPLPASFERRVHYYSKWKPLFPAIFITGAFFIIWDVIFTGNGVWGFNHTYTLDLYFLGLPFEEWMFFIVIPFCTVFIYECINYFFPEIKTSSTLKIIYLSLSVFLFITSILNIDRSYTFWNFLFTSIFAFYIGLLNPRWLGKFTITYFFHLIPFSIVNGILTGSFLEEPIVWYNNEENLGIRIFTIPIEDSMYSLLLLLMNISLFEFFKKYSISKT